MADLNLDLNYFDHPKVKRLAGLLGRGSDVLPIKLWAYCGRVHPVDGRLTGYTPQEVESIVGWWGQAGRFVEAMIAVGFLEEADDGYAVHEWGEYQGHIGAFHERAKKGAKARWDKIRGKSDASSIACGNAKPDGKQCSNVLTNVLKDPAANAAPSPPEKTKRKPPTGPHAELCAHYVARWTARYGSDYRFRGVDGSKCSELLAACSGDLDRAKRVIDRYFANGERFYEGHPLTQLLSGNSLPRFLVEPRNQSARATAVREDN